MSDTRQVRIRCTRCGAVWDTQLAGGGYCRSNRSKAGQLALNPYSSASLRKILQLDLPEEGRHGGT